MSTVEVCKVHDRAHCWKCGQDRIFDLEAENARLQQWIAAKCTISGCWKSKFEKAEALAERRGEALGRCISALSRPSLKNAVDAWRCVSAAIAADEGASD